MRRYALSIIVSLAGLVHADIARGHFLFIRIGAHAEAGRTVEVFFSERAEAGDPRFLEKVAPTKLSVQSPPGKFRPLTVRRGTDRLRAFLPSSGSVSVDGELVYGVVTRKVPFLLRYFPKAVSGVPKELNAMKPRKGAPLEIMAEWTDAGIKLTALKDGKPMPRAVFTTVDDDLSGEELTADEQGRVTWTPDRPGYYCVYTRSVVKQAGEYKGQTYTERRDFATLSFQWPLVRSGGDPAAIALFERALESRAVWKNFSGFTSDIAGTVDGRQFAGTAKVSADGDVTISIDEEAAAEWVEDQLSSIVMHRQPPAANRSQPVLRFADDDVDHPLGRLLMFEGGHFASSYRVRDGRISIVNRNLGSMNMTITVLDNQRNADGKYLPRSYTVQYWNADSGRFLRSETVTSRWRRIGGFDLPAAHTETSASESGLSTRTFRLTNHRLLPAAKQ